MNEPDDTQPGRRGVTRRKILEAAYELFTARGVNLVGVDTISAHANVAKMTLYHHFGAKENLVLAYLDLRAKRWTVGWLKAGVTARATDPRERLLAVFDLFHEWFDADGFEGCPFLRIICESDVGSPVHKATAQKLAQIENYIGQLARAAKLPDPTAFAGAWMMLMEGAILSCRSGQTGAALIAKRASTVLLSGWTGKGAKAGKKAGAKPAARKGPAKRKPAR